MIEIVAILILLGRMALVWGYIELLREIFKQPTKFKFVYLIALIGYGIFSVTSSSTSFDNPDAYRLIPIFLQAVMINVAAYTIKDRT